MPRGEFELLCQKSCKWKYCSPSMRLIQELLEWKQSPEATFGEVDWTKLLKPLQSRIMCVKPCKPLPQLHLYIMGMAWNTLEKSPCGLCWTILRENVLYPSGCSLKVAWSHPNVRHHITSCYRSSTLCIFAFWPTRPTCLRQQTTVYIKLIHPVSEAQWHQTVSVLCIIPHEMVLQNVLFI